MFDSYVKLPGGVYVLYFYAIARVNRAVVN